jgi:hypothetical protein
LVSHEFHGKNHTERWKDYTANFQIYRLDPGNLVTSLSYKNLEWVNDVVNPNRILRFDIEIEKGLDNLSKTNKRRNSPSSTLDS